MRPGVPLSNYLAGIWASTVVALLFLAFRLYVRLFRGTRRLFWDDAFVIFACLLVLISAALWQWVAPAMYLTVDIANGHELPSDFFSQMQLWLRVSYVIQNFFYISLAAVKLSLLFFFRRLGHHMDRFKYVWWPVVGFTLASLGIALGISQWRCFLGSIEYTLTTCIQPSSAEFTIVAVKINCALDVFSDFLIMLIPAILVWGVQMRLRRKLAFTGLFSLTLVTMSIAIVRMAGVSAAFNGQQYDPSYLWLYSAIEACIAIVIACLSSFPQLFVPSKKPAYTPTESFLARLRVNRARLRQGHHHPSSLNWTNELSSAVDHDAMEVSYRTASPHDKQVSLEHDTILPDLPKPAARRWPHAPVDKGNENKQMGFWSLDADWGLGSLNGDICTWVWFRVDSGIEVP
ncbi:hypothetical protein B0H66DRAFT_530715 [Apodospora peruviana]|uniref:Rhodopsin domain-containing protein n=1 Tax=Apodospora peruviana TaxID=516989 RepID=A0AAE0MBU7_9PEZI|nr:hypothetical protein B0H66DRAFT_530715 [Apodospora peruviana]